MMTSPRLEQTHRPLLPNQKYTQESSPPPSPTSPDLGAPNQHGDPQLSKQRILPFLALSTSPPFLPPSGPLPDPPKPQRPPLPGREVTPPSPPNSLLIHDGSTRTPVSAASTQESMESPAEKAVHTVETTPTSSLKEKFTRAFRGRGYSDVSFAAKQHKKGHSTSTNATSIHAPTATTTTTTVTTPASSSATPVDAYPHRLRPAFSRDVAAPAPAQARGSPVIHGNLGEVRVEIQPPAPEESGDKYYDYYTRSNSPGSREEDDGISAVINSVSSESEESILCPPIGPLERPSGIERRGTEKTQYSRSTTSSERRDAEQTAAALEFQGFHFGLSDGSSDARSSPDQLAVLPSYRSRNDSATNSAKASSTALPGGDATSGSRSMSQLSNNRSGSRSDSQLANRPAYLRNKSSGSQVAVRTNSAQGSTRNDSDEVTRELRRLSKISAGSGMSGMAVVVTADGQAIMQASEGENDEHGQRTRAEGTSEDERAASAVPSGAQDQRSSQKRSQERDRSQQRSSIGSAWTGGTDQREDPGDGGDDDSTSLLPGGGEVVQTRKLRAQEPSEDVLVHRGNPEYEFNYRMRQTSGDDQILVPQYRFPASTAFPNRNALNRPVRADASKTVAASAASSPMANRFPTPTISEPPTAFVRVPTALASYVSMPQDDSAHDSRQVRSRAREKMPQDGNDDTESLVLPGAGAGEYRARDDMSMRSLESFGGGFKTISSSMAGSFEDVREIRDSPGIGSSSQPQITYGDTLRPPEPVKRRSWDPARYLPARPTKFLRRSLTPHLYNPQDIAMQRLEDNKADSVVQVSEFRGRERKIGRFLILICAIFPPLLLILAAGGFDYFVSSWTNGTIKRIGGTEKRVALILGVFLLLAAVVGVVAGVSVAATS